MHALLLASAVFLLQSRDDDLLEIVRDAQVASATRVKCGSLTATVEQEYNYTQAQMAKSPFSRPRTQSAEVTVHWDGERFFMLAQLNTLYKNPEPTGAKNPKEINTYLYDNKRLYSYNEGQAKIRVESMNRPDALTSRWLFEVVPEMNWFRCCPPMTAQGRNWGEFLDWNAPFTPFSEKGTRVQAERIGQDVIRYRRLDPDGGVLQIDFSLRFGGNAISHSYTSAGAQIPEQSETIAWRRDESGAFVLVKREYESRSGDDLDFVKMRYRLAVKSCKITRNPSPLISYASFKGLVPKNAVADDRNAHKPSHSSPRLIRDEDYDRAVNALKAGGLFRGAR